nr:M48 family metallopeptidase [Paenibacillus artemisiicola]
MPRIPKLSYDGILLSRQEYAALYALVDEICEEMRLPRIDGLILDHRFNASYAQAGWRMKRYVTLGLPLFGILDREERIALIGHEIAHGVNRDARRSFFTLSAYRTLIRWHDLLNPQDSLILERNWAVFLSKNVLKLLSYIPLYMAVGFIHLYYYESQRAEYLADALSAEMSGTEAMMRLNDKLYGEQTFSMALQRYVLNGQQGSFFEAYKAIALAMPERERERIRRVELLEGSRLDYTHPPGAYRIQFLQRHYRSSAKVALTDERSDRIEAELKKAEPRIEARMIQDFQASLY